MREGNIFSLCVISHLDGGGGVPPSQVQARGGGYSLPRSRCGGGGYSFPGPGGGGGRYPLARSGQGWAGVPPRPGQIPGQWGTPYRNSIACTCYAAGGMPFTFTQDFLVYKKLKS